MRIDAIDPKKTAMIVVDMQNDFVAVGAAFEAPAARAAVPKIAEALTICRSAQIRVIYTAQVHRSDGCDMGLFDDLYPAVANRAALVDGTPGVDIYPSWHPRLASTSSKSIAIVDFLAPTWTSSCASGESILLSSRGQRPRIAATQPHATRCFATIVLFSFRTRPRPLTIRQGIWRDASGRGAPRYSGDPSCIDGTCDVGQRHDGTHTAFRWMRLL